jgi:Putative F0F1-ATPase subunit Ca2+/Mg2+ transporter
MKSNKQLLLQYAGFGFQLISLLGLMVYAGYWLDVRKLGPPFPFWVWLLPFVALIGTIVKVIKDTSKK